MHRPYEALVILKPTGTDAELGRVVSQLEEPIKRFGGQIDSSVSWGRRRLAYRIARQTEGAYHLVQFRIAPSQLDELKRVFRLNESIVRFLILNRTNHQHAQASPARSISRRETSEAGERERTTPTSGMKAQAT